MADLLVFPAPASAIAPADASERERALDTTRSFLVEAPAGSGKTGLLIQRFLKLLAGEDVTDPAQVLAITFTRKATGELRERVLGQLQAARAGAPVANGFDAATRALADMVLKRDAALGWDLLEQPQRLHISTIDGVTAEITRALPVLGGSAANLSPTENSEALFSEAARRTLMRLGGDDAELSRALEFLLLHRDGSLADVERLLAKMLATREQWGELIPTRRDTDGQLQSLDDVALEAEVLPRLERALDHAICRALTQAAKALPAGVLETLTDMAAVWGHAPGYRDQPSTLAICAGRSEPPAEMAGHLDHWRALTGLLITRSSQNWRGGFNINQIGVALSREQRDELKQLVEFLRTHDAGSETLCKALCAIHELPAPIYPAEQWIVTKALFRVLSQALVDLGQVFAERGQCDFSEPALVARAALRSELAGDSLEAATGSRLRHLLVDEMQDTSSGQYELIELLTRTWGATGETVFLVGDPKQSIYLFRQARVERFVHALATGRLGRNGLRLETLRLSANFRSRPGLVESFNQDFSRIFPAEADPGRPEAVPFYPASASRVPAPARSGPARAWRLSLRPYTNDARQKQSLAQIQQAADAEAACRIVRDWQSRPLLPERAKAGQEKHWRIAVLVRGRAHALPVVEAFRSAAIAYKAVDIDPLGERREVLDLLALTRALLHPADRTAWLALLRAPWCGLRLADLHQIAGGDEESWAKRTVLEALQAQAASLTEDGRERLPSFVAVMERALAQRWQRPLPELVVETWRALNAAACASGEELANAERFFTLLDTLAAESGGLLDLNTLGDRLSRLHAAASLTPGAVEIVTIHAAKGLEWDVVIVPALDRRAPSSPSRLLDWLELNPDGDPLDNEPQSLFAPIQGKGKASEQLNHWMRGLRNTREAAERKRLFYVVSTRAREELHLFASPAENAKGGVLCEASSLLKAAWPAVEARFADLAHTARQPPVEMPSTLPDLSLSLAAAAMPPKQASPVTIDRIPQRAPGIYVPAPVAAVHYRPRGSFRARAVGNALHDFMDHLAVRLATGAEPGKLLAELRSRIPLRSWIPRIRLILTAGGLGPTEMPDAASTVLRGLENTLNDPVGRWMLAAHPAAASELSAADAGEDRTLRIDRTFLAGATPGSFGQDTRWIIDVKTSTHGASGLEAWLEQQRATYSAQLDSYAAALREASVPTHLGLYFPLLSRLIWWPSEAG